MEFAGQHVLVMGLGVSGCSAARYCAERGARVVAADERPREAISGVETLPTGVELCLGQSFPDLEAFDLVVPSPGIPAERRKDVFRPFYRLDESRNPSTGGTGLGLTIARDVVRGHGGELTLEDSPTGGLRARVRLPA